MSFVASENEATTNTTTTNPESLKYSNSDLVLPAQSSDAQKLIQNLKNILDKNTSGVRYNRELRDIAYRLSIALETPGDTVQRVAYYPLHTSAIRIAMKLDLFTILVNSTEPKGTKELAEITGADRLLLLRLLRFLASIYVIQEDGEDNYSANNISKNLSIPHLAAGVKHTFDTNGFAFMALPGFLEQTKYQNPAKSEDCAFHLGHNTKEPVFKWLETRLEHRDNFNVWMSGQREGRANWLDFFPLEAQISKGLSTKEDQVMLVDVGGGYGHEIKEIKAKYPALPGRMILQDKPQVIAQAILVEGMEAISHDFFTPQPIKGAHVYYMRNIFHDWPDTKCIEILTHIADAMIPNHSKLLINELVIPDRGATIIPAQLDLTMMAVLAGMERTESHWHELLDSAGLVIIKIWTDTLDAESIIEAVLQ